MKKALKLESSKMCGCKGSGHCKENAVTFWQKVFLLVLQTGCLQRSLMMWLWPCFHDCKYSRIPHQKSKDGKWQRSGAYITSSQGVARVEPSEYRKAETTGMRGRREVEDKLVRCREWIKGQKKRRPGQERKKVKKKKGQTWVRPTWWVRVFWDHITKWTDTDRGQGDGCERMHEG